MAAGKGQELRATSYELIIHMPRRLHFTKFLLFSLALHALVVASALFLAEPAPPAPQYTPVRIVNLPQQEVKQLPPLRPPEPARPVPAPPPFARSVVPEKPLPPQAVPMPKKFGESEEITLPKTSPASPPAGLPGGAEEGAETGKAGTETEKTGPALARKQTG